MSLHEWTSSELERAGLELEALMAPNRAVPGHWPTLLREMVAGRIHRLRLRMIDLDVETPAGRRTYHELRGELRGLEVLMKPDFGLARFIQDEIEKRKQP